MSFDIEVPDRVRLMEVDRVQFVKVFLGRPRSFSLPLFEKFVRLLIELCEIIVKKGIALFLGW